ncbi:MAG: NAD-dependent epimerase/dehydratase family protein [Candidatus Heimdallarchaeaceae archaeon]
MRVLITGSTGFLGTNLVHYIKTSRPGWDISGFDLRDGSDNNYNYKKINFNFQKDWKHILKEFEPEYIFHLIGLFRGSEEELFATNVHSFERFIEGIRDSELDAKLIVMGSAAQYGLVKKNENPINENHPTKPVSPYGRTKNLQEEIALKFNRDHNLEVVCTRPSSFIGKGVSNQLLSGYLANKFRSPEKNIDVEISNAEDVRDYVDVRDVCQALVLLQEKSDVSGEIFNLTSVKAYTNLEMIKLFEKVSSKKANIVYTQPDKSVTEIWLDGSKLANTCGFVPNYTIPDSISWSLE